jgi:hypothetical protein
MTALMVGLLLLPSGEEARTLFPVTFLTAFLITRIVNVILEVEFCCVAITLRILTPETFLPLWRFLLLCFSVALLTIMAIISSF